MKVRVIAFVNITVLGSVFLLFSLPACSQESITDQRPRFLLNTELGSEESLGYEFLSFGVGSSLEIPIAKRFEFQGNATYSPDRKAITNDGQSVKIVGSALGFATKRLGFIATSAGSWLWTSQFGERAWLPSVGAVIRNNYLGPGRLYLTYVFPTGCVWATPSNSCKMQSKRLQGIEIKEEIRSNSHGRWGFRGGLYHFCDQGNPNDPQAGRNCHLGVIALATLSFEFHLGAPPHFVRLVGTNEDNF